MNLWQKIVNSNSFPVFALVIVFLILNGVILINVRLSIIEKLLESRKTPAVLIIPPPQVSEKSDSKSAVYLYQL